MKNIHTSNSRLLLLGFVATVLLVVAQKVKADHTAGPNPRDKAIEITILYDNYTLTQGLRTDWGFACMIKGTEKNILFDTGANGTILLENMDKLQIGAQDVNLVVISHDHPDHTGGLSSFLGRNNNVTVYLPLSASAGIIQTVESRGAKVQKPDNSLQICEGVHVAGLTIAGQVEQFLVLDTPKGLVVITGCAHPGIVQIIAKAKQMLNKDVYLVFGGFHLLDLSDSQVQNIIQQFKQLGVQKVGASHCTGGRAIELFKQAYGKDFVPIGVGKICIQPIVDFNGDWIVDINDLLILIQYWGSNESSVDIAPGLFGDGVVDEADLEVLMSYWQQEVLPVSLLAYWKLDQTEGVLAEDSAGDKEGTLNGNPIWQPAGGKIDGALQLDGINDYVSTPFVLNPADGAFSVFAWVKSGSPGKVIISQKNGANWLLADPSAGKLMTGLSAPAGRVAPPPLVSGFVITDGNWHRLGFVWDGSGRALYVDDVEVAKDTQAGLAGSNGGLYIGAGKGLEAGSFWSGLIDDIRIHNRAVTP